MTFGEIFHDVIDTRHHFWKSKLNTLVWKFHKGTKVMNFQCIRKSDSKAQLATDLKASINKMLLQLFTLTSR